MTTRSHMREMMRNRLKDHGPDPLWDDEFLNDAIAEGIRRYSTSMPRQTVTKVAVLQGDQEIAMPDGVNALRVVRLFNSEGQLMPRWKGMDTPPPVPGREEDLTWRVWANTILLGAVVKKSGIWRIEHLVSRVTPDDDSDPLDIQPNDEDIILALALSVALSRRAIIEGRRYLGKGGVHPLAAAARTAQVDADRMFWSRSHKLQSGGRCRHEH